MRAALKGLLATATIVLAAGSAHAEAVSYKVENDGIKASLTGKAGNAKAGRDVMINRKLGNCLSCHVITKLKDQPFHGEVGPSLDGIASRYSAAELRLIIVNSKAVFEDTIMPAFYRTSDLQRVAKKFADKTILTPAQVEDVVAYLVQLKEEE